MPRPAGNMNSQPCLGELTTTAAYNTQNCPLTPADDSRVGQMMYPHLISLGRPVCIDYVVGRVSGWEPYDPHDDLAHVLLGLTCTLYLLYVQILRSTCSERQIQDLLYLDDLHYLDHCG